MSEKDSSGRDATYLRIDGLAPEDFADAETGHDETAAHDLADRVFGAIHDDYPELYDELTGVVPVVNEDAAARLDGATGGSTERRRRCWKCGELIEPSEDTETLTDDRDDDRVAHADDCPAE